MVLNKGRNINNEGKQKRIVIAGGGQLALYLVKSLCDYGYYVSLIEQDMKIAEKLANEIPSSSATIIGGNCTDTNMLKQAMCENADCFIATTGRDEVNIVACKIAKELFHVKNTIVRAKNPKNKETCKRLNIDHVYSSTDILVSMIEKEMDYEGLQLVYNVPDVKQNIVQIQVSPFAKVVDKKLSEIKFPENCRAVLMIYESKDSQVPLGDSIIEAGMKIMLVCSKDDHDAIYDLFAAPKL